jgi:hypothetical protein
MLISETGSCSRLHLVFVHAENDTTMPWVETEALFKSTLKAAIETTSLVDSPPTDLKVVDLGEAGRQEVWQSGSKCIQKTIAKHGGKRSPAQIPAAWLSPYFRFSLLHKNHWTRANCFGGCASIYGFLKLFQFHVSSTCPRPEGTRQQSAMIPV